MLLLNGVLGGRLQDRDGTEVASRLVAPDLRTLRHGVPIDGGLDSLTAAREKSVSMVVPTDVLAAATSPRNWPSRQTDPLPIFDHPQMRRTPWLRRTWLSTFFAATRQPW
jgi:hypothetical protein